MARRIDEERLLDAALDEFSAHSFAEASVNTIISRAGISKGSFYYRFATKYDLYLHVLEAGVRKKWEYIHGALTGESEDAAAGGTAPGAPSESVPGGGASGAGPPDIFDTFLLQARAGTAFAHEHSRYHRLSIMLSKEKGTDLYEKVIRDLGQTGAGGLEEAVREAIRRGEIRSDLGEKFVVKIVAQLLMKFDELLFEGETWSLDAANERLGQFVKLLRHGLASR